MIKVYPVLRALKGLLGKQGRQGAKDQRDLQVWSVTEEAMVLPETRVQQDHQGSVVMQERWALQDHLALEETSGLLVRLEVQELRGPLVSEVTLAAVDLKETLEARDLKVHRVHLEV